MFQFSGLPRAVLWIQTAVVRHYSDGVAPFGYPRIVVYNDFPWLFAVYCVLHRLLAPRYSPCALCSLTNVWITYKRRLGYTPRRVNILQARTAEKGLQTNLIGGIRTSICSFQGTKTDSIPASIGNGSRTGYSILADWSGTFQILPRGLILPLYLPPKV